VVAPLYERQRFQEGLLSLQILDTWVNLIPQQSLATRTSSVDDLTLLSRVVHV